MITPARPLFKLGQIVATPGALEAIQESNQDANEFLERHLRLDPGELCEEDQEANRMALGSQGRIFSAYKTKLGVKIWIITEADRSSTCILLPDEY